MSWPKSWGDNNPAALAELKGRMRGMDMTMGSLPNRKVVTEGGVGATKTGVMEIILNPQEKAQEIDLEWWVSPRTHLVGHTEEATTVLEARRARSALVPATKQRYLPPARYPALALPIYSTSRYISHSITDHNATTLSDASPYRDEFPTFVYSSSGSGTVTSKWEAKSGRYTQVDAKYEFWDMAIDYNFEDDGSMTGRAYSTSFNTTSISTRYSTNISTHPYLDDYDPFSTSRACYAALSFGFESDGTPNVSGAFRWAGVKEGDPDENGLPTSVPTLIYGGTNLGLPPGSGGGRNYLVAIQSLSSSYETDGMFLFVELCQIQSAASHTGKLWALLAYEEAWIELPLPDEKAGLEFDAPERMTLVTTNYFEAVPRAREGVFVGDGLPDKRWQMQCRYPTNSGEGTWYDKPGGDFGTPVGRNLALAILTLSSAMYPLDKQRVLVAATMVAMWKTYVADTGYSCVGSPYYPASVANGGLGHYHAMRNDISRPLFWIVDQKARSARLLDIPMWQGASAPCDMNGWLKLSDNIFILAGLGHRCFYYPEKTGYDPMQILFTQDNGDSWEQFPTTGLPASLTNTNCGVPGVYKMEKWRRTERRYSWYEGYALEDSWLRVSEISIITKEEGKLCLYTARLAYGHDGLLDVREFAWKFRRRLSDASGENGIPTSSGCFSDVLGKGSSTGDFATPDTSEIFEAGHYFMRARGSKKSKFFYRNPLQAVLPASFTVPIPPPDWDMNQNYK